MAHELDERWTLYIGYAPAPGQWQTRVDGRLTLRILPNGDVDRLMSRHEPNGLPAMEIDGRVDPDGTGYRVTLFAHLPGHRRQTYRGNLIARAGGQLILAGHRFPPETIGKDKKRTRIIVAGQEDGTWVATKP